MKYKISEDTADSQFFSSYYNQREFEKFLLMVIGICSQHVNLFDFDFNEYNFRLIFYGICL